MLRRSASGQDLLTSDAILHHLEHHVAGPRIWLGQVQITAVQHFEECASSLQLRAVVFGRLPRPTPRALEDQNGGNLSPCLLEPSVQVCHHVEGRGMRYL